MTQAIILCGGKGTRLRPYTNTTPKPMLPICGIPHLEYQIKFLKRWYISEIIMSCGYLHSQIVDYFGDGSKHGVKITYREDGDKPLGTAGAVKNCEDQLINDEILVLNGDILTNINLSKLIYFHNKIRETEKITIVLTNVEDSSSFGVASIGNKQKINKFIEKPRDNNGSLINAGIYMVSKSIINKFPPDTFWMFETDVFGDYIDQGKVYGFTGNGYWLDIGTHERYEQANMDVLEGRFRMW